MPDIFDQVADLSTQPKRDIFDTVSDEQDSFDAQLKGGESVRPLLEAELEAETNAPAPTTSQQIGYGLRRGVQAAGDVAGSILQAPAIVAKYIMGAKPEDQFFYPMGAWIKENARKRMLAMYPEGDKTSELLRSNVLTEDVPSGIGSSLAFLTGGGAIGRVLGSARGGVAAVGALSQGVAGEEEARAYGASPNQAFISALLNAGLGLTEAVGIGSVAARLDKASGGTFSKGVQSRLLAAGKNVLKETVEEALQEGVQSLGEDVIAKSLAGYDPERELGKELWDRVQAGGISGALISGLTSFGARPRRIIQEPTTQLKPGDVIPGTERNDVTTRTAEEVLDEGATVARVPGDGQDRANLAQIVAPRAADSAGGGAPGEVGAVVPPEVASGTQVAPVVYRGYQEGFRNVPGYHLYNLTEDLGPKLVKGSTVTEESLLKAGYTIPEAEKAKAVASKAAAALVEEPPPAPPAPVVTPTPPPTQPAPQGPPPPKRPTTTSAPPADVALLDLLGAKHNLTAQQAEFVLQAFKTLPENANPEALQKAYLKLALPADMPAEVGLGKVAGIAGAKQVLSDLREASAGVKALPVGEPKTAGPTTRSTPPPAKAGEGARETGTSLPNTGWTARVSKGGTVWDLESPTGKKLSFPVTDELNTKSKAIERAKRDIAIPPVPVSPPTPQPAPSQEPEGGLKETPPAESSPQAKIDDIRKRRDDIKARLRAKFGQLGSGVDPEIATIAAELAVNYAEEGVVRFSDFARRVKDDLPDIWERLKHYLGGAWRTAGEQNMDLDETTRGEAKAVIDGLSTSESTAEFTNAQAMEIVNKVVGKNPKALEQWPASENPLETIGLNPSTKVILYDPRTVGMLARKRKANAGRWLELALDEELSHRRQILRYGEKWKEEAQQQFDAAPDEVKSALRKLYSGRQDFLGYELLRIKDQLTRLGDSTEVTADNPDYAGAKAVIRGWTGQPMPKEERAKSLEASQPDKKESEEQEESRIIKDARSIVVNGTDPLKIYRALVKLYQNQPRLGTRTVTSKTNQAYSTPAPLAYIASQLADVRNGQAVVEPTAGNGMLLIDAPGTRILANELDAGRRARLENNFPHASVSGMDASTEEYHDTIKGLADRMIMNPPFGGVIEEGTTETKRFPIINASTAKATTPSIDLAIALNTLDAMTPDGRAVVLIGAKTGSPSAQWGSKESRAKAYQRPEMLEFFKRFNVVDWFTVDGDLYNKMGAGWPVDVIVIDGKKPTPASADGGLVRPWITPPPVFETWESLESKFYEAQRRPATESSGTPRGVSRPTETPGSEGRPPSRPVQPARSPDSGGTPPPVAPVARPERPTEPVVEARRPDLVPESRPKQPDSGAGVGQPGPGRPDEAAESGAPLADRTAGLNVPYVSVSKNADPKLVVPSNIADAMRRSVRNLETEVGKTVDAYVAEKMGWTEKELFKHLSSAQIEAVGLFIRNSENRGTGLINSDQTGVGKGRVVASVIEYARRSGKVPIFVTQGKHLYSDMAGRDLPSVGVKDFKPFITDAGYVYQDGHGNEVEASHSAKERREAMRGHAQTGILPKEFDGIFTTYDQLKSDKPDGFKEKPNEKMKRKKKLTARPDGARLAMLRRLAPNAIFVLDEAHMAAGPDSDVGLSLQSILKDAAGVFYASATFAKRPDNLTLYSLGTGLKLAKLSPKEMAEMFKAGGVPLQQAMTSMLAEEGEFVRREQDMSGVKVGFKVASASPEQEAEKADSYTSFLRDLYDLSAQVNEASAAAADAENQVRPEESEVDITSVNFGARLFNLSAQYLFALRAKATSDEAVAALKRGQKPFIAVYNTMAGPIADLAAMKLPLNFGGLLRREMHKMLEVKIKDPTAEADPANRLKKGERLLVLKPEDLPDGGAQFRQVEEQIENTDFSGMPISPIDAIKREIIKAGYKVGEITARDGEVDESGGTVVLSKREKRDRNKVLFDYNNGVLDVIVVNGSGSTGLSAHADPRFKDQRQRYMIVAQAAPDINVFMQMLGRVMRFGQTSLPEFVILTTTLAAERRFMTMLRGKLTSLNANTSADTESGMTQGGLADDIFNQIGDEIVAEVMLGNPVVASLAKINMPDRDEEGGGMDGYARYATGRFVLLPNDDAERLWTDISDLYTSRIRSLDEAGENPLKANVQDLRAQVTGTAVLERGTGKTAFDGPVTLDRVNIQPTRKPYSYTEATGAAESNDAENTSKVREWMTAQRAAAKARIDTMVQRESASEQIDRTRDVMRKVQENVIAAQGLLGKVVAVDPTGSGTPAFYAVPISVELRSKEQSDFSASSKHTLRLATNTLRRTINLPLSQLDSLKEVGAESEAVFDDNSESTSTRYVAGNNLLRAYKVANALSAYITKPAVTIYTTRGGQLKTGVLLGAAFNPATATESLRREVSFKVDFAANVKSGTAMVAGPVKVNGTAVTLPSGSSTKFIWGDRGFELFFESSPVERRGEFTGRLKPDQAQDFYTFLLSKKLKVFLEGGKGTVSEEIKFTPVESKPSDTANQIADSLEKLKLGKPGEVTDFFYGMTKLVWNGALRAAQAAFRLSGKIADGVAAGLAYIRANHKGEWDEAGATAALESSAQETDTDRDEQKFTDSPEFKANAELADELGIIRPDDDHSAATDEGVLTKVGNVHDVVLSRPGLNDAVRRNSVAAAKAALEEAGLNIVRAPDGLWKLANESTSQEAAGEKLVPILEREIQAARTEDRRERLANLLNSIAVHLGRDKNGAFSQSLKNRLYALAQGERSSFGRALGALAMWGKVLANVAQNPGIHLGRIYSEAVTDADTETVIKKIKEAVAKPTPTEREASLKKIRDELTPKQRKKFKSKTLWDRIQRAARAGLFDENGILEELAREQGFTVPTEEQKAQMREWVDEEERLRTPTARQIAKAGGDMDKAAKETLAGTETERLALIKKIQAHWSRWALPTSWNPLKWRNPRVAQNNAKAVDEFVGANLLFKLGFATRQLIDVALVSAPLHAANRSLAHVLERAQNDGGFSADTLKDLQGVMKEMATARIASLKATVRSMERTLTGHTDRKTLDRMNHSIGVFERMNAKADALFASGNKAASYAVRFATILRAGYRVAEVLDAFQAVGLEWQEMRQQLSTDLRAQGKSRAEIAAKLDDIFGGLTVDMLQAVEEVRAIKGERGLEADEKNVQQDAWALLKARAYDRMRLATGLSTDYRGENETLAQLHAWNLPETGGIGGLLAETIKGIRSRTQKSGIPTGGLFSFGNAIGIAANRMATFSGLGLFGGWGFGDSPWYQGARNIRQRRIEAVQGLAAVGLLTALAAAGKILVQVKYPDDKDEKEKFIAEGHKLNTIKFINDDGTWIEYPIQMSPFSFIAGPAYMIGGMQRLFSQRQREQDRLNADAARTGATPGKARAIGSGDIAGVIAQGMYGMLTGGRTASGAIQSFSDYGDFNLNKSASALLRPYIPAAPAWQEASRLMGVTMDTRTASLFELLVPTPSSPHQRVNSLGDPMINPNDGLRVLQVLSGGIGFGREGALPEMHAYRQIFASGYSTPDVGRTKGYNFDGVVRPMTPQELDRYAVARGQAFKRELEGVNVEGQPEAEARKTVQSAFQRANREALQSVGVTVPSRAESRASGRPASGGGASGAVASRPSRAGRLPVSRRLARGGRLGRVGIRRARLGRGLSRLRRGASGRQPRLGRVRRRGLSRARLVA